MTPLTVVGQSSPEREPHDSNLAEMLKTTPDDATYAKALQFLGEMETQPTCHRTATSHLIVSCQEVDGRSKHGSKYDSQKLDFLRDVYAARLALCELERAGTPVPLECSDIADFTLSKNWKSSPIRAEESSMPDELRRVYLRPCTQALYSNQQQWTSYSNSHQSAIVTCQAARIDVEKDNMVKIARSLASNSQRVDEALTDAILRHERQLESQLDFAKTISAFHRQLVTDLDATTAGLKFGIADIVAEVERDLRGTIDSLLSSVSHAHHGARDLRDDLHSASTSLGDLVRLQQKMRQETYSERAEMASEEKLFHEANRELAMRTQQSLETVNNGEMGALIVSLTTVSDETVKLGQIVSALVVSHAQLGHSIQATNSQLQQYFSNNEARLQAIDASLVDHLERQEIMKARLNGMYNLLGEASARAKDLHADIEGLADISTILRTLWNWCQGIITLGSGLSITALIFLSAYFCARSYSINIATLIISMTFTILLPVLYLLWLLSPTTGPTGSRIFSTPSKTMPLEA